ncbi:sugar ABC transporter substrate-binding protein [Ideonella sp. 4Y11]|uniref:Sugar ABC transporter substrate-binding protein n=1 Tax=Ideonella aquatica TaxID=2824119 RepID=A0A940YJ65_9BURK|nr:sugar ABC transporter substrate-binding protein [Ideonella aquatica]MBQ0961055.1 sugar ABC transporter substrate-binding protein [Ideonella aquatica]
MSPRTALLLALACVGAVAQAATELVIATVDNAHMIEMQKLSPEFERSHPDIRLTWVTLPEGTLRERVSADIARKGGRFDVMTIGMFETPIWARKGWLQPIPTDAAYDVDDLLPAVRGGLSVGGRLYAAPFYGEGSMLMYRKDLAERAGVTLPDRPSWDQVKALVAKVHDPKRGVWGICLRGKPGWGENMALISTLVNTHGGQWFDMAWRPQIDSQPWREAIGLYAELMKRYGPPQPGTLGYNELLAMFSAGRCGVWVDASIAASFVTDPKRSRVAAQVALAMAPTAVTPKGAVWLWSWNLAVPAGSAKVVQAMRFVTWATSKEYVQLVARRRGWAHVPTGTRRSTYASPAFKQAARFATAELAAIELADPQDATLPRSPYVGVQFASIAEFPAIGNEVGRQMGLLLADKVSVAEALKASQAAAEREMAKAGYYR